MYKLIENSFLMLTLLILKKGEVFSEVIRLLYDKDEIVIFCAIETLSHLSRYHSDVNDQTMSRFVELLNIFKGLPRFTCFILLIFFFPCRFTALLFVFNCFSHVFPSAEWVLVYIEQCQTLMVFH